jgi:hypothetical protein
MAGSERPAWNHAKRTHQVELGGAVPVNRWITVREPSWGGYREKSGRIFVFAVQEPMPKFEGPTEANSTRA